jgi:hypothetical protein
MAFRKQEVEFLRASRSGKFGIPCLRERKRTWYRGLSCIELPALEFGLALFLEGRDPLIGVLGHEHPADRLALHGQAQV